MKPTFLIFALAFAAAPAFSGQADVYIGVSSRGGETAVKIGLAAFVPQDKGSLPDAACAQTAASVVRADLLFSRYFDTVETGPAFDPSDKNPAKRLGEWEKMGAQYVLAAKAADSGGQWTLSAKLYDASAGSVILEKYYKGKADSLRRAAHLLSDELVWRLKGRKGIAHTKIAFANDSTGKKEIYVVDYDGEGLLKLTDDKTIALFPRWSPDGGKLYYTTYRYKNPDAFEIDLKAGKIRPFSLYQGINLPGGVSPDGGKLAVTLSRSQDPDIYLIDTATKELKRLTAKSGVNSSASFSPDGKFICFISDRSGNPQVHVMEIAAAKTQRLTRLNWCDSPQWSPSGEWIVFSGRAASDDPMDIFLVDITGSQLKQLTRDSGSNEDPAWSADGRFISFTSTRNKTRQIYVMDADGSAPHLVSKLAGGCYTPSWSP